MKNIGYITLLLAVFGAGVWVTKYYYSKPSENATEQSEVLLEKVKTVCKLVTVEGYFTEIYDYKDYWGYDFSPFRKKALIRVKAKVSVGFDMEKMTTTTQIQNKLLLISNLPQPSILSIDHDLDYYDVTEGTFNNFTAEDYTQLNAKAKDFVRQQVEKSGLLQSAAEQGNKMTDIIRTLAESMGWRVETTEITLKK